MESMVEPGFCSFVKVLGAPELFVLGQTFQQAKRSKDKDAPTSAVRPEAVDTLSALVGARDCNSHITKPLIALGSLFEN